MTIIARRLIIILFFITMQSHYFIVKPFVLDVARFKSKRAVALLVSILFVLLFSLNIGVAETLSVESYAGGDGTSDNPYQIATLAQLRRLSETSEDWSSSFILTADIDASETTEWNGGEGFSPIGSVDNNFKGNLDGNGHTIAGLTINRPNVSRIGLLGYYSGYISTTSYDNGQFVTVVQHNTIKDITLENVDITGQDYVAGLVGYLSNGSLTDCSVSGTVEGNDYVGGLIGELKKAVVINKCQSSAQVSGNNCIGGLIGGGGIIDTSASSGEIQNCSASGNVSGSKFIGGLIGYTNGGGPVSASSASGNVSGSGNIGGLIGTADSITIDSCSASGDVVGGAGAGGLCGVQSGGEILSSAASGDVSGSIVGGLVGASITFMPSNPKVEITGSIASGTVNGTYIAGGIVGKAQYAILISDSSSLCNVSNSGNGGTGGILGQIYYGGVEGETITRCTASGTINGGNYCGGILGYRNDYVGYPFLIEQCIFEGDVSGSNFIGGIYGGSSTTTQSSFEINNSQVDGNVITSVHDSWVYIGLISGSVDNVGGSLQCSYGSGSVLGNYAYQACKNVNDEWVCIDKTYYYPDKLIPGEQSQQTGGDGYATYYYDPVASCDINNSCLIFDGDDETSSITAVLSVYDNQTGAFIENASVQLGETTRSTDSDGEVTFTDLEQSTYSLEISANGYSSISLTQSLWAKKRTFNFSYGLEPYKETSENVPEVKSVVSNYSSSSRKAYFLDGTSFLVEFKAEVDWHDLTPGTIEFRTPLGSYATTDGNQSLNMGDDFGSGGRLVVVAYDEDGTPSEPYDANIEVMAKVHPYRILFIEKEGTSFKYTQNIEVGFPEITNEYKVPDEIPFIESEGWKWNPIVEVGLTVNQNLAEYSALAKQKVKEEIPSFFGFSDNIDIRVGMGGALYRRYQENDNEWEISGGAFLAEPYAAGKFKTNPHYWMIGVVPSYGRASLEAFAQGGCSIGMEDDDWIFAGKVGGGIKGSGSIGIGVSDYASVEGKISLGAASMGIFSNSQQTISDVSVDLTGEATVTLFVYKKTFKIGGCTWEPLKECFTDGSCNWSLFSSTSSSSTAALLTTLANTQISALSENNEQDWLPMSRDYGGGAIQGLSTLSDLSTLSISAVSTNTLPSQEDIFPYSEPALANSTNSAQLVWVADDQTKNSYNRTSLFYSTYEDGGWTEPIKIVENGTADFYPTIGTLRTKTILAWQDSNTEFGEDDITLEEMLASQEIAVSLYDPETKEWSATSRLTSNDTLDRTPVLATSDSSALLIWVNNASNEIVGSGDAPNTIRYGLYNGSDWVTGDVVSGLGAVIGQDVVFDAEQGTGTLVYVTDEDGDLSSTEDQELFKVEYSGGSWGDPTQLSSDSTQDVNPKLYVNSEGAVYLFWKKGDNIVQAIDFDMDNVTTVVSGEDEADYANFELVLGTQDKLAFLWAEGTEVGQNLFAAVYDETAQVWGEPVQITATEGLDRSYTAMFTTENSSLLAVYNHVNFDGSSTSQIELDGENIDIEVPETGSTDLRYAVAPIAGDIAITSDAITVDPELPVPYDTATLSVAVSNLGMASDESASVSFYYGDPDSGGELIGEQEVSLNSGESSTITQDYTVPAEVDVDTPVYAVVSPGENSIDSDTSNNKISNQIFYRDLSIAYLYATNRGPSIRRIVAVVKNTGAVTCQDIPVAITYGDSNIYEGSIDSLEPNESYEIVYEWDVTDIAADEDGSLLVEAIANADKTIQEVGYSNNSMKTIVQEYGTTTIDIDSDFDGMSDAWETSCFDDLSHDGTADSDEDGLTDLEEYELETNPLNSDSDGDGMPDGWEQKYGLDPVVNDKDADADADGITNYEEYVNGSDPSVSPPINDNFSTRIKIDEVGVQYAGTNIEATFEAEKGEPDHEGEGSNSVWWTWTPLESGIYTIYTSGSNFNTVLAVYSGTSLDTLSIIESNNQNETGSQKVIIAVEAGDSLQIVVDGSQGETGAIVLEIDGPSSDLINDNFANAIDISERVNVTGTNVDATFEDGEPDHLEQGSNSVWWKWQAQESEVHIFTTAGSEFDTVLAVYTGDSLENLELIVSNDDSDELTSLVSLDTTPGEIYYIAVDGYGGAQGAIQLRSYQQLSGLEQTISILKLLSTQSADSPANTYNADLDNNGKVEIIDAILSLQESQLQ